MYWHCCFVVFFFFFFRLSFPNCISCVSTAMIFAFILTLLLIIGLRLRMLGISKAKLKPIVKPHLMSMKTTIVPLVRQLFIKKNQYKLLQLLFQLQDNLHPKLFHLIFLCIPVFVFQLLSSIESMELLNAEHLREQVRVL